jgi:hypothetical protein
MFNAGVARLKPAITACGRKNKGKATAHLTVGPDGKISQLSVSTGMAIGLAACIDRVLRTATFAPTREGGTFNVPYAVR